MTDSKFDRKAPLAGKRILVTRAADQAEALSGPLEALGAVVFSVPVTAIEVPANWSEVDASIKLIDQYDWLVFASVNAVSYFLGRCRALGMLEAVKARIAVVGPATAASLERFGLHHDFLPSVYVAEDFLREFVLVERELPKRRILWPRGNLGRTLIADELRAYGALVDSVTCYVNVPPQSQENTRLELSRLFRQAPLSALVFTSSQSVKSFAQLMKNEGQHGKAAASASEPEGLARLLADVLVVSIGPETTKSCRLHLGKVDGEAKEHTMAGVLAELLQRLGSGHRA